jgi:large subunit ribosomal protein L10
MSLTREQKEQRVAEVEAAMSEAASVVFVAYNALTVAEVNELRGSLFDAGGAMRVIPKRLLKIALNTLKVDFDPLAHDGQVAVVWGTDAVAPAKALSKFADQHEEKIRLLAGTLEGNLLTLEEVTALAKLPTREQLLGQLASVLVGPARGLVTVLSGAQRNLVQVLAAIQDQKNPNS